MDQTKLTFLFQEPAALVIVLPIWAFAWWSLLTIYMRAGLLGISERLRNWIVAVLLVLVAWIPLRALIVLAWLGMSAVVGLVVFAALLGSPWGRRTLLMPIWRRNLRRTISGGFTFAPLKRVPPDVEEATKEFEALGFDRVAMGKRPNGAVCSLLVRPADGVIAEVLRLQWRPSTFLSLTSVVEGRRGILSTGTFGVAWDYWPKQISETFPGASPAFLAARHDEARRLLEEHGVRLEAFGPERALDHMSWMTREVGSAFLGASEAQFLELGTARRTPSTIPRFMRDDPSVLEKIQALRPDSVEDRPVAGMS